MWPNDPIQTREIILIPVDACSLKGKKVSGPDLPNQSKEPEIDLLSSEPIDDSTGWAQAFNLANSSASSDLAPSSSPTQSSSTAQEPPWKHDSCAAAVTACMILQFSQFVRQKIQSQGVLLLTGSAPEVQSNFSMR